MGQTLTTEGFFGYDPGVGDLQVAHFGPEYIRRYVDAVGVDRRRQDQPTSISTYAGAYHEAHRAFGRGL